MRNNAIHLVIPLVPKDIMGLFQAGALNYPRVLKDWFNINLSDRIPLGMMVLVYDFDPKKHSLEYAKMTRRLPKDTIKWITEFQVRIKEQAILIGSSINQFYIPIEFSIVITKNPRKADIVLNSGFNEKEALVLEVPKDIDRTHPYRGKEVVELVNQELNGMLYMNSFDILCIRKVHKIENKAEYYYKSKYSPRLYSKQFIDWIISKIKMDNEFLVKTRGQCKLISQKESKNKLK